ncbi:MAG: DNA replication/repair protein RecF [Chloroflexi bacterium]|nr:DNA replication/repair protein RecF [Chloroflexota bacterium]
MDVTHLSLTNFRNYARLELDLPAGIALFHGANAQGKTNLLEAIYFLATTKSPRATADRELINWLALEDPLPASHLAAAVHRRRGNIRVEIGMMAREARESPEDTFSLAAAGSVTKRVKVNGIVKRAVDFIGHVNVVHFSPQDIDLVTGAPAVRRRYLDVTNAQVDGQYVRALQQYNRVLLQRNHLLRLIRDRQASADQLAFWDEQLVTYGSAIVARRQRTVGELNGFVQEIHRTLTGSPQYLETGYRASVGGATAVEAAGRREGPGAALASEAAVAETFRRGLREVRAREILQGASLVGPHRDDLAFRVDRVDVQTFGSRGQQRTVALAMKLAEARFIEQEAGETPILLLDDVLSELDHVRRRQVLSSVRPDQQVLITTTELDPFAAEFLARAALFAVAQGRVCRAAAS